MAQFLFKKPEITSTIPLYISCRSTEDPSYYNLSFKDEYYYPNINEYFQYTAYNVVSDYIQDIRDEYCDNIDLTDDMVIRYRYRPKLMSFDMYNTTELGYMILLINDKYSPKQFTLETKKVLLPSVNNMKNICNYIFNANKQAISIYNYKK